MGLGELDRSSEKGSTDEIYCSICLDGVRIGGGRSTAKLECGHEFHLDCIGSAFNAKGAMQCPNCREIGNGNWLFSNGSSSLTDRSFEEWSRDEDLYDFSYSEMAFTVHWCPFNRLARVLPSYEEGEAPPAIPFQDIYHAMLTRDPDNPSNPPISAESHYDNPTFHRHHRSHTSRQTNAQAPPPSNFHYHNRERHPLVYSQADSQSSGFTLDTDTSATVRPVLAPNFVRRAVSPARHFVHGHGSNSRSTGSFMSTVPPPYYHANDHYQHQNPPSIHGPMFPGLRRSGMRTHPAAAPYDPTSYYLFPPTPASSSRSSHEAESTRSHTMGTPAWLHPLPQSASSAYSRDQWGVWHRNRSERPSTEGSSHPVSRMRPYH